LELGAQANRTRSALVVLAIRPARPWGLLTGLRPSPTSRGSRRGTISPATERDFRTTTYSRAGTRPIGISATSSRGSRCHLFYDVSGVSIRSGGSVACSPTAHAAAQHPADGARRQGVRSPRPVRNGALPWATCFRRWAAVPRSRVRTQPTSSRVCRGRPKVLDSSASIVRVGRSRLEVTTRRASLPTRYRARGRRDPQAPGSSRVPVRRRGEDHAAVMPRVLRAATGWRRTCCRGRIAA
jgi:hypothetical protein